VGKTPLRGPAVTPPQEIQKPDLTSHLVGTWEHPGQNNQVRQMVFAPGGQVTFQGGLEFFNPGQWSLDPDHQELKITFPSAPEEKLDIFHLLVGQGVRAFDRNQKQVTYHFDEQTWTLNIAGWIYSKPEKPATQPDAEPVLR
jgi:hypothetical protein